MTHQPILAEKSLPKGAYHGARVPVVLKVEGGLHYLRGNRTPYFSLTCTAHRKGFPEQYQGGGADHTTILRHWPRFADLAELHLSDVDGVPMHAEANGWYWLAGAAGGLGERFHGGNGSDAKAAAECLAIFARHCRIGYGEAVAILLRCLAYGHERFGDGVGNPREMWKRICESMKPQWKAEAEACIARHNLKIYGDTWKGAA